MLMIPTSVADVSCHAVSPGFSQLGSGFRVDNIAIPHLMTLLMRRYVACALVRNCVRARRAVLRPRRTDPWPAVCTPRTSGTGRRAQEAPREATPRQTA